MQGERYLEFHNYFMCLLCYLIKLLYYFFFYYSNFFLIISVLLSAYNFTFYADI